MGMDLKTYLKSVRLSPAVLAQRVGCSYNMIYKIARKFRKPSYSLAWRIEEYTKGMVTIKELMED